MTVAVEMRFEAAHHLPLVPEGHKCRRLHGHSYRCEVRVTGPCDPRTGWVMDFAEVRAQCEPLRQRLDHHYLNQVEGLENPTAEHVARWIWQRLEGKLLGLSAVVVHETCAASCTYTGET